MLLGSDLDGVVIDIWTVLEEIFENEYGVSISYECISSYKIEDCTRLDKEQVDRAIDKALRRTDLPLYKDAVHYIQEWIKEKGQIIFITSRKKTYNNETFLNLAKYFKLGDFNLFFANGLSKSYYVNSMKIDFFLEDRVKYAIQIAEECPDCAVLLMDRPWNWEWDESYYDNVTRVYNWEEVKGTLSICG